MRVSLVVVSIVVLGSTAPAVGEAPCRERQVHPSKDWMVEMGGPRVREERVRPRRDHVWQRGRSDWSERCHHWLWLPGRWARTRPGERWSDGHWTYVGPSSHPIAIQGWGWVDGQWNAVVVDATEPPPAPRDERRGSRKGQVWIAGNWDWADDAWQWVPGRWEQARDGQRWQDGHWEPQGGIRYAWVPGVWVDAP